MAVRYPGQARIDPGAPQAVGVCDRCGFLFNLRELQYQWYWAGTTTIKLDLLVCEHCFDEPNPQLITFALPPDPPPVYNPRPENFAADFQNFYSLTAIVGAPAMFPATSGMSAIVSNLGKLLTILFGDTSSLAVTLKHGQIMAAAFAGTGTMQAAFQANQSITAGLTDTGALAVALTVGRFLAPTLQDTGTLTASLKFGATLPASLVVSSALTGVLQKGQHLAPTLQDTSAMTGALDIINPASLSYINTYEDPANTNSYNFAGVSFGAAVPSRRIVIAVHWGDAVNSETLASASIGGVAATIHGQTSASAACRVALISALVPTGTSGTVNITLSGAVDRCGLGVYRAINETSGGPTQVNSDNTASSGLNTTTVNVPSGGWVVAATSYVGVGAGQSFTWSGVTEQYDTAYSDSTNVYKTGGYETGLSLQSNRPISSQCSNTSAANGALVAMSWG